MGDPVTLIERTKSRWSANMRTSHVRILPPLYSFLKTAANKNSLTVTTVTVKESVNQLLYCCGDLFDNVLQTARVVEAVGAQVEVKFEPVRPVTLNQNPANILCDLPERRMNGDARAQFNQVRERRQVAGHFAGDLVAHRNVILKLKRRKTESPHPLHVLREKFFCFRAQLRRHLLEIPRAEAPFVRE